jgi:hypothetical protein
MLLCGTQRLVLVLGLVNKWQQVPSRLVLQLFCLGTSNLLACTVLAKCKLAAELSLLNHDHATNGMQPTADVSHKVAGVARFAGWTAASSAMPAAWFTVS